MTKKLAVIVAVLLCLASVQLHAQMTDNAIIQYLTEGIAAGKSEAQLGNELLSKGVSVSQIQRLLKVYKSGNADIYSARPTNKLDDVRPIRKQTVEEEAPEATAADTDSTEVVKAAENAKRIYGHDVFTNRKLSFEPNDNAATPDDYVLGPGDEVIIDIWGVNEATIKQTISPEGRIIVSQIGAIDLGGLTIKAATKKIRSAFAKRYAGIGGSNPASEVSVTLGQIRTIQVNVMGAVNVPGTYRLSSFSTVFNALYRAGGVTAEGSLRDVRIIRGGEVLRSVDTYNFLFNGIQDNNLPLKEGDVVMVPAYANLVSIDGGVKRPMYYEMLEGETLEKLLEYAGGLTGDAYADGINVVRRSGSTNSIYTVSRPESASFAMRDRDSVIVAVNTNIDLFTNKVEVRGAVYRPGSFELGSGIATVRQLIEHAGGLLEDAFTARAQIIREKADRTLEIRAVPIGAIMSGAADDVMLRRNDIVMVSSSLEVIDRGDLTITGYVVNPGAYQFADNTTVEDLILLAGGLSEGASTVKVDVSRRISSSESMAAADTLAEVFTFGIKDGLMVDGEPDFVLKPYDIVSVRKSPTYVEQRNVTITGEASFPGQYTLVSNNERLSDLLKRAGGPTPNANVHGAMLKRKITQYERNVRATMGRMATQNMGQDTSLVDKIRISEIYSVGLELDKAIALPGSEYDIILRDGDELVIPEMASTVRIQGEVLYPNTVHYISGKPVGYYVNQAGGYADKARRAKVYVIYMNGKVATGQFARIEPGCEIVVPNKRERQKLSGAEIASIGSSTASMAAVIISIITNLNKNK